MADFTICSNLELTNELVTGNGEFVLAEFERVNNADALELVVEYSNPVPPFGTVPRGWSLKAFIEKDIQEHAIEIIGSNTGWNRDGKGNKRRFLIGPDTDAAISGEERSKPGDHTREIQVSEKLSSDFRVKIVLSEVDFGTPAAFQSARVTIFGRTS